jgi:hypothetical protein
MQIEVKDDHGIVKTTVLSKTGSKFMFKFYISCNSDVSVKQLLPTYDTDRVLYMGRHFEVKDEKGNIATISLLNETQAERDVLYNPSVFSTNKDQLSDIHWFMLISDKASCGEQPIASWSCRKKDPHETSP